MVDLNRDRRWTVPINRAPGFANPEVYHPRWARHPRFMAMSGPYDQGGANQVRSGGKQAEIWLGRFQRRLHGNRSVGARHEQCRRRFLSGRLDRPRAKHASAACQRSRGARRRRRRRASRCAPTGGRGAPGTAGPVPTPESIAPYRHALVVSRYEIVNVVAGSQPGTQINVAHWAIRDAQVLTNTSARGGGLSVDGGTVRRAP